MALRLLALMGVVGGSLLPRLWLPLGAMALAGYGFAAFSYFRGAKGHAQEEIAFHNPFELRRAVEFGLVYGAVLFVSAAAQRYFGAGGTYASAAFAGLADVDAIALSLAELHAASGQGDTAANAIVLAALVNTATKTALCVFIGRGALAKHVVPALAAMAIAGAAGVFLL
jgi:uncharacterized membrane protein (DUF4010 family)